MSIPDPFSSRPNIKEEKVVWLARLLYTLVSQTQCRDVPTFRRVVVTLRGFKTLKLSDLLISVLKLCVLCKVVGKTIFIHADVSVSL